MDSRLRNFIESCLQIDCRKRPTPEDLLQNELFKDMNNPPIDEFNELVNYFRYFCNSTVGKYI